MSGRDCLHICPSLGCAIWWRKVWSFGAAERHGPGQRLHEPLAEWQWQRLPRRVEGYTQSATIPRTQTCSSVECRCTASSNSAVLSSGSDKQRPRWPSNARASPRASPGTPVDQRRKRVPRKPAAQRPPFQKFSLRNSPKGGGGLGLCPRVFCTPALTVAARCSCGNCQRRHTAQRICTVSGIASAR